MNQKNKILIAVVLILLGASCRILPHPFNFAPIAAVAMFAAVYLGVMYALVVPALAMFLSDIFIGFYSWPLLIAVYGSYALIGLFGLLIKRYKSIETVMGGAVFASILFFIITNFAVWQFSSWYSHSLEGLASCFIAALPFFRNTLMGNLFYVGVMFGIYELALLLVKQKKIAPKLAK